MGNTITSLMATDKLALQIVNVPMPCSVEYHASTPPRRSTLTLVAKAIGQLFQCHLFAPGAHHGIKL